MLYETAMGGGGFGSSALGTFFGAGDDGIWGLFPAVLREVVNTTTCESCQRARSSNVLGRITILGSYVSGGWYYIASSDVALPMTCYELVFSGPGGEYTAALSVIYGTPPPILVDADPTEIADSPPDDGVVIDTLLRARLPEISETGDYSVTLIDRCGGTTTALSVVELEAPAMILGPQDADLSDFPELMRRQNVVLPASQPSSGVLRGIPLDYCEAVVEFDGRFGELPADQGWTWVGSGGGADSDYALVETNTLHVATPGPATLSYWAKTETLSAAPTRVFMHTGFLEVSDVSASNKKGEGLDFQALIANNAGPYSGVRFSFRGGALCYTSIDTASEQLWADTQYDPQGWHALAAEFSTTGAYQAHFNAAMEESSFTFGTTGTAPAHQLVGRFGDTAGFGLEAYIKHFVASTPGRFVRAWFRGYAQVADPKIRIYVVADSPATADQHARFKLRYGSGMLPYDMPASEIDATLNFVAPNTAYEVRFDLSGLVANAPFWFTVERDWSHSDDLLQSTVWLTQVTVRAQ